jgi:hypothetical protein
MGGGGKLAGSLPTAACGEGRAAWRGKREIATLVPPFLSAHSRLEHTTLPTLVTLLPHSTQIDNTYNKLQTLCEYIDDTEVRLAYFLHLAACWHVCGSGLGGRQPQPQLQCAVGGWSLPSLGHPCELTDLPRTSLPNPACAQDYINIELDSHRNALIRVRKWGRVGSGSGQNCTPPARNGHPTLPRTQRTCACHCAAFCGCRPP